MSFQGNPIVASVVTAQSGTAAQPSMAFLGDVNNSSGTGMFLKSAGTIGIASNGSEIGSMSASAISFLLPFSGKGTTTNNDAAAGYIGEYMQASRLKSAATAATTATSLNVLAAPLSLTAGDWDVSACLVFLGASTTNYTLLKAAISKTSATLPATDTIGVPTAGEVAVQYSTESLILNANDISLTMPCCRISLAATTNIYLVANATFATAAMTVYGSLNARRVR